MPDQQMPMDLPRLSIWTKNVSTPILKEQSAVRDNRQQPCADAVAGAVADAAAAAVAVAADSHAEAVAEAVANAVADAVADAVAEPVADAADSNADAVANGIADAVAELGVPDAAHATSAMMVAYPMLWLLADAVSHSNTMLQLVAGASIPALVLWLPLLLLLLLLPLLLLPLLLLPLLLLLWFGCCK